MADSRADPARIDLAASIDQKDFTALPLERRLEILPYLPPSRRRNYVLACEDSKALVEAMQPQDLFLTIKEIGLHDAAEIVGLASPEQFQNCLDLDCWNRDEIDAETSWQWLTVLSEAGLDVLMSKVGALDFEVAVALFAEHVKVHVAREDFDPDEGVPPGSFTADGTYYLTIDASPDRAELVEKMVTDLFHRDSDLYLRLLSAVRDGMSTPVQEEALRWRTARLADLGFPEYVESLKVYSRPDKKRERRDPRSAVPKGDVPPSFAIVRHDGLSVVPLDAAARVDSEDAAAVAAGAAYLVNWLAVADRVDPGDVTQVRELMQKARGYVSIGLHELGGDPAKTLASTPMLDIFRAGFARAMDLAERAKKIVAEHPLIAGDKKALRLDEVSRETVSALLQPRPLLYLGAVKEGAAGTGHFSSPQDVAAVSALLDKVDASAEVFGTVLKIFKKDLLALDLRGLNLPGRDELTVSRVFNTAVAQKTLKGAFVLEPVAAGDLKKLHVLLFVRSGDAWDIAPAAAEMVKEIMEEVERRRPDLRRPAMQFMNACLEDLRDSLAHVDFSSEVKPDFIGALIIRK
jgi:hypothetical protein